MTWKASTLYQIATPELSFGHLVHSWRKEVDRSNNNQKILDLCMICGKNDALKVEKLKENIQQLKQGKESAENQIKTMSTGMMNSLEKYRQGFDDMLERNKAEAEESRKKLEDEIEQWRKQVHHPDVFCHYYDTSLCKQSRVIITLYNLNVHVINSFNGIYGAAPCLINR